MAPWVQYIIGVKRGSKNTLDGITAGLAVNRGQTAPRTVEIAFPKGEAPEKVTLTVVPYEEPAVVNLAPAIANARGKAADVRSSVEATAEGFKVVHPQFEADFSITNGLEWKRLFHRIADEEVMRHPEETKLFVIEREGKRIEAREWEVKGVDIQPQQAKVRLGYEDLEAVLTVGVEEKGLALGLDVTASDGTPWKALFPHVSGLQISDNLSADYYLFPYYGGIINNTNANLRSLYGVRAAWWQMVSLFSPEKGAGMGIRALDTQGIPKGIALRKGLRHPSYAENIVDVGPRVAPDYLWEDSLEASKGTAVAFEYSKYLVDEKSTASYPGVLFEFYEGGWKPAMESYADWATSAWQWQEPKMQDRWNLLTVSMLQPVRAHSRQMNKDGQWYADFVEDDVDIAEYLHWWQ